MLIKLLILFFILLFIYQLYYYFNTIQEGLGGGAHFVPLHPETDKPKPDPKPDPKYQSYGNDPNTLIYKNAGNISVLTDEIKKCTSNADQISTLTTQVNNLQKQVNTIATSQSSQFPGISSM
jgi:hypothetical protein